MFSGETAISPFTPPPGVRSVFYKFLRKEVSWCHDMVCYLSLLSLAMSDELDCLAVWGVYPTWYRLLCTLGPRILGYGGKRGTRVPRKWANGTLDQGDCVNTERADSSLALLSPCALRRAHGYMVTLWLRHRLP